MYISLYKKCKSKQQKLNMKSNLKEATICINMKKKNDCLKFNQNYKVFRFYLLLSNELLRNYVSTTSLLVPRTYNKCKSK